MATLADKTILSGAENRPPMLEKYMYDSWKRRMEQYMMNRQHGRMILESVENGPRIWPLIEKTGVTRPKKYFELSVTETIQADCDVKATNIILQGLPPEVYALVMPSSEESNVMNHSETEITSDSNIIPYSQSFTALEKQCISLKVDSQLNQEIFQPKKLVSNQSAPSFDHYFELNKVKSQSQEKDTVISKLKDIIKSISGHMKEDKIKKELEEIGTINIELVHRVSKLIAKNEYLKQTYKQLYDSIKSTRIRLKEQCDDLINQVNLKSVEISDLNASLQENVLVITALKDALRKLRGKALADDAVTSHSINPEMLNVDVEPLNSRLLNNRSANSDYLKHTQEEALILREIVEQGKSQNPLNAYLDSAYKYTKQIQELFIIIEQTCHCFNNSREKLLAVTLKNKDKRVRFTEAVTPLGNTITNNASSSNLVSNKPALSSTGHFMLNANSELICVKCNGYMLSDNHDLCVLNVVTARVKSKSVNKNLKRKVWKPTRKVFINIGYTWRPTGRTFTIVGNAFPLTRITTTTKVPSRKPIAMNTDTPKPVVTLVYSRKPRKSKSTNLVSKSKVGISHEISIAHSPQQNGVIKRRNLATTCYTQNRSIIRLRHDKTPYEIIHDKLPNLSFFNVFGALCYLTNDSKNLGKLQLKADIGIFIGYTPTKKAFWIYKQRTRRIIETIHVDFDELTVMASKHSSSGPALYEMTHAIISSGLVPNPPPSTSFVPPSRTDWDMLFQ
nr:hypothetical protein [Tanacetum cinerariifolium]